MSDGMDEVFTALVQLKQARDVFDYIGSLLLERQVFMTVEEVIPLLPLEVDAGQELELQSARANHSRKRNR